MALVTVVLLLSTARGWSQEVPLVRLTFGSGWDALPAIVGIERGLFLDEGLLVSGLASTSGLNVIRSIGVGTADFAVVPQRTFLVMAGAELPVKVVAMSGWGTVVELVVPKSDATSRSVADLKGKRIAVGVGSDAHPVLIRLLNRAKLRPSDVQIVILDAPQLTVAFKDNLADAVFETGYFTAALTGSDQGRVLMSNADIVSSLGFRGAQALVTRDELIKEDPETVQKFVRAWVRALTYIRENPDDAAQLLAIYFHRQGVVVRIEQALAWLKMVRYDRAVWTNADIADAEFNGWGLVTGNLVKQLPKLAGYFDNRFVEQALKAQQ